MVSPKKRLKNSSFISQLHLICHLRIVGLQNWGNKIKKMNFFFKLSFDDILLQRMDYHPISFFPSTLFLTQLLNQLKDTVVTFTVTFAKLEKKPNSLLLLVWKIFQSVKT